MSFSTWAGHQTIDPQELESRFCNEDSMAYMDAIGKDFEKQITLKPVPPGERFNTKQNQILVRLKRSNIK